jgi:conserved oligomeric Golgi complex subunit 1
MHQMMDYQVNLNIQWGPLCAWLIVHLYIQWLYFIIQVVGIFEAFLSTEVGGAHQVTEKGVLQLLLDVKFVIDVLSGGDSNLVGELSSNPKAKSSLRRKQGQSLTISAIRERSNQLLNRLSQRLDPIDWLT